MSLEHCWRCPFFPILLLVTLKLRGNEACVVPRTLCSLRWFAGVFSTFKVCSKISFYFFLALFSFNLNNMYEGHG